MSKRDWASVGLAAAGVVVLAAAVLLPPPAGHPVSETMEATAGTMAGRRVTTASAEGSDGRTHSPADAAADRPLVLVFIMTGCPCSEGAEAYFHRLHAAYGSRAAFLGVTDGDPAAAAGWVSRHGTPYSVLSDPARTIIRDTGAVRSAYVALVAPGGVVEALWPGYSAAMLADVGARLARRTGLPEVPLDTAGAPDRLTSGCPF